MGTVTMVLLGAFAAAQDAQEKVRKALGDVALVGPWKYNDLASGFAEAKRANKPMLVVFR